MLGLALALALPACAPGVPQTLPLPERPHDALFARRMLERARALEAEERYEAALRVSERGLTVAPEHARLLLLRARLLERLDRPEEARAARARADAVFPPRPPPPEDPLEPPGTGLQIVLLAPEAPEEPAERVPAWPEGPVAEAVRAHLRARLPEARLRAAPEESALADAAAAAAWLGGAPTLSLRIDRAFCGRTLKDGAFALVWLRVAAGARGALAGEPMLWREVLDEPRSPTDCRATATRWALEAALAQSEGRRVLRAAADPGAAGLREPWSPAALHGLLPPLAARFERALREGREALARGELEPARAAFERAVALRPGSSDAATHLAELERSLSLSRELERRRPAARTPAPSPASPLVAERPDPVTVASLERQLARERGERQRLLASLAEVDAPTRAPGPETLALLRPVAIADPRAAGPRLAARRYGRPSPLEARALYAPDGSVVARFYFGPEGGAPLLREQDSDGDGRPDHWLAFQDGLRVEAWEDAEGSGRPTVHLRYEPGAALPRAVEVDADLDGRPERVLQYEESRLAAEAVDADGDGHYERFDRFDARGRLALREEDLDGDGQIDRRSRYRDGRLTRREILDPALIDGLERP